MKSSTCTMVRCTCTVDVANNVTMVTINICIKLLCVYKRIMCSYDNYPHTLYHSSIYVCNGCNMCMGDLPDMYAYGPRAASLRDEDIHIRQIRMYMLQVLCNTFIAIVTAPIDRK